MSVLKVGDMIRRDKDASIPFARLFSYDKLYEVVRIDVSPTVRVPYCSIRDDSNSLSNISDWSNWRMADGSRFAIPSEFLDKLGVAQTYDIHYFRHKLSKFGVDDLLSIRSLIDELIELRSDFVPVQKNLEHGEKRSIEV